MILTVDGDDSFGSSTALVSLVAILPTMFNHRTNPHKLTLYTHTDRQLKIASFRLRLTQLMQAAAEFQGPTQQTN